jgi:hypothetical protein
MATEHVEYHSVPEIVINWDGPEERRITFVDDFGGTMQLSTQQPEPDRSAGLRGLLANHRALITAPRFGERQHLMLKHQTVGNCPP